MIIDRFLTLGAYFYRVFTFRGLTFIGANYWEAALILFSGSVDPGSADPGSTAKSASKLMLNLTLNLALTLTLTSAARLASFSVPNCFSFHSTLSIAVGFDGCFVQKDFDKQIFVKKR